MSLKMCLYSITYLGIWYDGRALTWKEVLQRAKDMGYEAVEFDAKRPHANPMDWDADTRRLVVDTAGEMGLALPALSANNDFSSPIPELREAQLLMVKEQLRLARDLGCKCLRVFAAWRGITMRDGIANYEETGYAYKNSFPGVCERQRWEYVRDCLKEACKYAEEYGVYLALQNHAPLVSTWQKVHRMIQEVDSPWLKACFDLNPECDDPSIIRQGFDALGDVDVHFHFNGEWERQADGSLTPSYIFNYGPLSNYGTFVEEMKRVGYDGYLAYEFCHPATRNGRIAGIDMVDEQARYAIEYMRSFIDRK